MNTGMTIKEFEDMLLSEQYCVWNGVAGYDTRPYIKNNGPLPVPYWEGYANNYIADTGNVEGGDIANVLKELPEGTVIIVPDYYGCHYCGETHYIKKENSIEKYKYINEEGEEIHFHK